MITISRNNTLVLVLFIISASSFVTQTLSTSYTTTTVYHPDHGHYNRDLHTLVTLAALLTTPRGCAGIITAGLCCAALWALYPKCSHYYHDYCHWCTDHHTTTVVETTTYY